MKGLKSILNPLRALELVLIQRLGILIVGVVLMTGGAGALQARDNKSQIDLRSLFSMKNPSDFSLYTKHGIKGGHGSFVRHEKNGIEFIFQIDLPGSPVESGRVVLEFVGSDSQRESFRIQYQDNTGRWIKENVQIERYLLENHILTFRFGPKNMFFHISKNRSGDTVWISDAGRFFMR